MFELVVGNSHICHLEFESKNKQIKILAVLLLFHLMCQYNMILPVTFFDV